MAAEKPNRGRSAHQDQRLYTIRPLRWRRSEVHLGSLYSVTAVGLYYIGRRDGGWRVSLEPIDPVRTVVAGSATLRGAKMAATLDLERRLRTSLKPVRKGVRRG